MSNGIDRNVFSWIKDREAMGVSAYDIGISPNFWVSQEWYNNYQQALLDAQAERAHRKSQNEIVS